MDTPPFETMNLRYVKNENHLTFFEITLDEAVHSLERVIAPQLVSQFECSSSDGRQFSTECGGGERMLFSLLCGLRSLDWTSDSQRSYSVRSLPGQKHAVESQFFFQRPHSESAALPLRASQVSQGVQRSSASGGDGEKMILRHAQAPADCASAVSALPAGVAESAGGSTTAVKKEKRRSVDEDKMVFFSHSTSFAAVPIDSVHDQQRTEHYAKLGSSFVPGGGNVLSRTGGRGRGAGRGGGRSAGPVKGLDI